jgi:hypothetical protein
MNHSKTSTWHQNNFTTGPVIKGIVSPIRYKPTRQSSIFSIINFTTRNPSGPPQNVFKNMMKKKIKISDKVKHAIHQMHNKRNEVNSEEHHTYSSSLSSERSSLSENLQVQKAIPVRGPVGIVNLIHPVESQKETDEILEAADILFMMKHNS